MNVYGVENDKGHVYTYMFLSYESAQEFIDRMLKNSTYKVREFVITSARERYVGKHEKR